MARTNTQKRNDKVFRRADWLWDKGQLRAAFRLFLMAAKSGDRACQLNVGAFYADGLGVRRNITSALYWYRRAYRRGDAAAANNIGVVWRDEQKFNRALYWFKKAAEMGDAGANLQIANIYVRDGNTHPQAIAALRRLIRSSEATERTVEQARHMLAQLSRKHSKQKRAPFDR